MASSTALTLPGDPITYERHRPEHTPRYALIEEHYSERRFSVTPEINAISTFVLVIPVLVIGLMQWLQNRVSQRR